MTFITLLIQVAVVVCIGIYVAVYLVGIKQGTVKPILATWAFFAFATVLSFLTDFAQTGRAGVAANLFNIIDTGASCTIFVVLLCKKDIRKSFTVFEKICISMVAVVFIGWIFSGQNIAAHLAVQAIMVIAYLPTLVHLWNAQKNTESLTMWSFDSLASVLGLIEPIKAHSLLPIVYGARSTISTFLVILLILRIKYLRGRA